MSSGCFPRLLPLSSVLGRGYEGWVCHLSFNPLGSVFLSKIDPAGRMSPVQVPDVYASLPGFGLGAFAGAQNVRAERLFSQRIRGCRKKSNRWDLWVSALVADPGGGEKNAFCSHFEGHVYLCAHAVPRRKGLPATPVHIFVLPSMLVGPDSLLPRPEKWKKRDISSCDDPSLLVRWWPDDDSPKVETSSIPTHGK